MDLMKERKYVMKKALSLILVLAFALSCMITAFADDAFDSFGAYEHVFIIGIDGAGAAFGKENVETPNFDRIFKQNAYTHTAKTEYVTVSAQNWGSILTGVSYDMHGLDNDITGKKHRKSDTEYKTIFYYARQAFPKEKLVSFCHWHNINYGIIEKDLHVHKVNRQSDALVAESIVSYFRLGNVPKLMFVQLDGVDHAAHTYGGFSDEYYEAVETVDVFLGDIYDAIDDRDLMQNSLFIVVADHGETADGHGGQTPEESSAVLAVAGHSVNKTLLGEDAHNRDVASIALYALGIEQPDHFVAQVPDGLFGESKLKVVEPNPLCCNDRAKREFLYFLLHLVNLFARPFDAR